MPKISDLAALTSLSTDDLLAVVDSPASGAATKKITAGAAREFFGSTYNVKDFGAVGDVKQYTDGVTTASSTTFTSATATFVSADTGKTISISGAGAAGIVHTATITFVNSTTVTLSAAAVLTTSGKTFRYGTNDTAAIQAAVDAANTAGQGVVFFPAGNFGVKTSVTHKLNVVIQGVAMDVAVVWALADNIRPFEDHLGATPAFSFQGMEDLTIHGCGDLLATQGGDECRHSCMRAERIWWRRCHGLYGRQMGFTGTGTYECRFEDCVMEKTLRDGLNATGSYAMIAIGNTITECADDAIAFHISAAYGLGFIMNPQSVVVGNRITKSGGIKCMGTTNAVICNNSGRFLAGYGVYLDADTTFGEGYKDQVGIVIANNSFLDIISLIDLGTVQDVCWGIMVGGTVETVGSANYGLTGPGTGTAAQKGQTLDAWDKTGEPSTGTYSTLIANNVVHQMLESTTVSTFSGYGFGNLWWTTGYQDPTFYGSIARTASSTHGQGGSGSKGIKLQTGATRDICVTGNKVYGFHQGIDHEYLSTTSGRAHYRNNEIIRCVVGVRYYTTATTTGEFIWEGNYFDLDPLFEAAERTVASTQPTGTWTTTGANSACAFQLTGSAGVVQGVHLRLNTFKNVAMITARTASEVVDYRDNYLILDPVTTSPSYGGVNVTDAELFASRVLSTVCDPRLATYDNLRSNSNAQAAAAMPAAGVWAKGTIVQNTARVIGTPAAGKILYGWLRLTSGSNNVLNTDWMALVWANS